MTEIIHIFCEFHLKNPVSNHFFPSPDFEENEKKKMARELEEYESKLTDEEKKDREKNEKRINGLNKRKDQLIKDKKKKQEVGFLIYEMTTKYTLSVYTCTSKLHLFRDMNFGVSTKSSVSELWPSAHGNWWPTPFKLHVSLTCSFVLVCRRNCWPWRIKEQARRSKRRSLPSLKEIFRRSKTRWMLIDWGWRVN